MDTLKQRRRESSLVRLENSLKSGVKIEKVGNEKLPLSDKDKSRMKKEIEVLKLRIS